MSSGKLAAQVAHCAEAYWTRVFQEKAKPLDDNSGYEVNAIIPKEIFDNYINDAFTKTICEAKNKNHLLKAKVLADEMGLIEGQQYGLIYDKCLTELIPEEENGTTITGIWFCPLSDDVAHFISKKYQLYK
jgi:peptidyl-tRNA hydrolase